MKSRLLFCFCLAVSALGFIRAGFAQGCIVTMNPTYGTYHNESSDGTKIYTSVLVDGSAGCQPSASCNCSGATHTPEAYNKLGTVGGWSSGTPGCVNCYLSYQNNQSITATPSVQYTFVGEGEVVCSLAGAFYVVSFPTIDVRLAYTKSVVTSEIENPSGSATCYTSSWCTPATTPPLCNPSSVIQQPLIVGMTAKCYNYYSTIWLWEKIGSAAGHCLPLIPGQNATGTQDTSLSACTH